jgi:VanZ family protein
MEFRFPMLPAWLRWSVVAAVAGIIFYASILTVPPETALDTRPALIPLDKWRHFIAYAALGNSLAYATTDWDIETRRLAAAVLAVTILCGVGIEFGQSLTPDRYFSIGDIYANLLGSVLVLPHYVIRPHLQFLPVSEFIHPDTL